MGNRFLRIDIAERCGDWIVHGPWSQDAQTWLTNMTAYMVKTRGQGTPPDPGSGRCSSPTASSANAARNRHSADLASLKIRAGARISDALKQLNRLSAHLDSIIREFPAARQRSGGTRSPGRRRWGG